MTVDLDALEAACNAGLPEGGTEHFEWLVQLGVAPDALAKVLGVVVSGCFDGEDIPERLNAGVAEIALGAFAIGLVAGRNEQEGS